MNRLRNKKQLEILKNYKKIKSSTFDFERIAHFFINEDKDDAHQVIPYHTLQDFDFEELFMYADRTCSKIGQQYLYAMLRIIPKTRKRATKLERIISYLNENPDLKDDLVLLLNKLDEVPAYYLQNLFFKNALLRPKWFWIVPLLAALSVISLFLSFIQPVFVLVLIPVLSINSLFHYWNKKNILTYSNAIPQLLILNKVAERMIQNKVFFEKSDQLKKSNNIISEISRLAIFFKMEVVSKSELGIVVEYLLEIIKASFLLEPILLFKIVRLLNDRKSEIKDVFCAVAEVDAAISISSFRESLPFFTLPEIIDSSKSLYADKIYHPLLVKPVSNSIDINGKSILITGSNMSGKTTFIRTIGMNSILAQTINTVCAEKFVTPWLRIHSAIRISDSLLDDTSYYYKEVKTIKKMVIESDSPYQNLFLLDELFKGTNTIERISSGNAVLSYLNRHDNLVVVSTHDVELTDLLHQNYDYFHFSDFIENDQLNFDYKMKKGKLRDTNAIRILEINDFPVEITENARTLAKQIQNSKNGNN